MINSFSMLQHKNQASYLFEWQILLTWVENIELGVIQKVLLLETSSFWPSLPPPHPVRSCSFYMYSPPSTYVGFSKLPPPPPHPLKKSSATLMTLISNKKFKKLGSEKREKNFFFCKLNIKNQCFLHSYIYSDNTNIYMSIKKR